MQGQCSEHEADSDGGDSVDEFVHDVFLVVDGSSIHHQRHLSSTFTQSIVTSCNNA
jgi:hypothetical protein